MTYTKINRREARKLFNNGEIISMGASKMRPEWSAMVCNALNRTFEQVENEVRYYNCNAETGRRVAYYSLT